MISPAWILIVMMRAGDGEGGVAIAEIKFRTQASCVAARAAVLASPPRSSMYDKDQLVSAVCVVE